MDTVRSHDLNREENGGSELKGAKSWYVADHDRDDAVVRGPYRTSAEAAAVRHEMERSPDEERNLWILPK